MTEAEIIRLKFLDKVCDQITDIPDLEDIFDLMCIKKGEMAKEIGYRFMNIERGKRSK